MLQIRWIRWVLFSLYFKSLGKLRRTLESGELIMGCTEVTRSKCLRFLMETSWYVSATRLIWRYPSGSILNNFQTSCLYISGIFVIIQIAAMRSLFRLDYLFGSTDITNFVLFIGVVKVTVKISNNLLFVVWHLPPSVVATFKGAWTDMGYFAMSKFSRSLVHKKNFSLIWQVVFKLGYVFCQEK